MKKTKKTLQCWTIIFSPNKHSFKDAINHCREANLIGKCETGGIRKDKCQKKNVKIFIYQ